MAYTIKPIVSHGDWGGVGLIPLLHDATEPTPVESPISPGDSRTLKVPPSAIRLHLIVQNEVGPAYVSVDGHNGAVWLKGSQHVVFDVAGMGDPSGSFADSIVIDNQGGDDHVSFWFDVLTPNGK